MMWPMRARSYRRAAIATPHYLATEAGAQVLAEGGNAVDALVAANLALGIVAPYYCGMGGDVLAMVWDGGLHAYRSTGRSPANLDRSVLIGEGHEQMPVFGPHAVTVPGAVRGWFDLLDRWGTRTFDQLAQRAVELARDGFVLTRPGAHRLGGSVELTAALTPGSTLATTYPSCRPGDVVRQPNAAATLTSIGRDGPDAFYRGPIARAIVDELARHGGRMTMEDLAAHESEWVEPLTADFAGRTVAQLPPPTQGATALQALRMAVHLDPAIGPESVDRWHHQIEICRLALADRDAVIADPAAMTTEAARLFDDDHVRARAALVDPEVAESRPPRPQADGGTAYLCAADAEGLLVSLIQSNFTAIGSGVHVADHGINLHNRGAAFTLDPAAPNAVAGAKLPLHTLIPAMVLTDGRPSLVFGTMGGQAQAQIHLQVLTRHLLDACDIADSVAAPRFEVNPGNGVVGIEARAGAEVIGELQRRGHEVRLLRDLDDACGHAHGIEVGARGYVVGADPRAESAVAGR